MSNVNVYDRPKTPFHALPQSFTIGLIVAIVLAVLIGIFAWNAGRDDEAVRAMEAPDEVRPAAAPESPGMAPQRPSP